jgi:peptidoglycan/LPS O-acetylase OafA/YrhL
MKASRTDHLGWVDTARAAAAVYVVLHHAMLNVDGHLSPDSLEGVLAGLFAYGHVAVDVFIVLSGFCLMLPLARAPQFGSAGVFFLRRTARILLPYYAAMALSLLLIRWWIGSPSGTHWDVSLPVRAKDVASHLLMIHQWGDTTSATINHAFWSVGVEYQIYFLFPLLFLAMRRMGTALATLFAVVAGYSAWAVSWAAGWPNPSPYGASMYYLGLFALGAAAAQWAAAPESFGARRPLPAGVRVLLWTIALGGAVGLLTEGEIHHVEQKKQVVSFYAGVLAALLMAWRARRPAPVAAPGPAMRMVRRLGVMGFSLYLVHAPVLELVWRWGVRPMPLHSAGEQTLVMMVAGLAASIAVAALFHAIVERPCHRLSRALGRGSRHTDWATAGRVA